MPTRKLSELVAENLAAMLKTSLIKDPQMHQYGHTGDGPEDAAREPLPVSGYTAQSAEKVALVNSFKEIEERLLRELDALSLERTSIAKKWGAIDKQTPYPTYDLRWIAVARTHFQEGFMALNRAVFQPQRIRLPEDDNHV